MEEEPFGKPLFAKHAFTHQNEVGRQKVVPYHDYDTPIIYSQNFSNTTYVKK